ncbi:hypothetical protein NKDENANG_00671 [Candidatus Entotheonellaceae bacterium PAL068K]
MRVALVHDWLLGGAGGSVSPTIEKHVWSRRGCTVYRRRRAGIGTICH